VGRFISCAEDVWAGSVLVKLDILRWKHFVKNYITDGPNTL
jgi:hypothetical protein